MAQHVCRGLHGTTCLYRVTWHNMVVEGLHGTTCLYRVTWHNMFV